MREYKFRGKARTGWKFGSFWAPSNEACKPLIYERFAIPMRDGNGYWHEVDADTVGQFTGLLDSEGKEIYEGDIVDCQWVLPKETQNKRGIVKYMRGCFMVDPEQIVVMPRPLFSITGNMLFVTIIGNIHDNPALMEVEHD